MTRRVLFVLCATLLCALAVPALPALAGGGCHEGPTTGSGDTIEMVDACFTPSTLHVDPGAEVTFVNRDDFTHNVGANQWGNLQDMNLGDAFTATFEEVGVYPFACSYHPGMTGAVIVGDGSGDGNGEVVTIASYRPPASPAVEVRTVRAEATSGGSSPMGWVTAGAIGLFVGIGAGALLGRRGRSSASA